MLGSKAPFNFHLDKAFIAEGFLFFLAGTVFLVPVRQWISTLSFIFGFLCLAFGILVACELRLKTC